ncbi:hypothetical protein EUTSA_v10023102mg [Eutrema salsugineum]|uniref:FBD domain-containing protein n=1 Tax=Eutrema salsugineum TaxID=72664 RepID=V4M7P5_EUTSA|nr:hypothetical protein EUTSA_v10023102mg [Eutrema salsugineum]
MDSISSLPNEIICHIVSSLSAKEAAFTTVLSKRWLNLFTIIPNLHFSDWVEKPESFVGQLVALPDSSRVRKFTLLKRLGLFELADEHVHCCLCNVLKRGLMDLELNIERVSHNDIDKGKPFSLPFEIFTCQTLVTLKLGTSVVIYQLPENALLPALKTLILDKVRFYGLCGCAFQKLLSACPVLEELVIDSVDWEDWKWSRTVSSPTLQRLNINRTQHFYFDGSDFGSITFYTPKLVYLEYADFIPDEYPVVNFDSLVEAMLDLFMTVDHTWNVGFAGDDDPISSNPTNLLGLEESIPIFENLNRLSYTPNENDDGYCMRSLPFLLTKSPNLETLVLECSLHYDQHKPESVCKCMLGYSCLLSCPAKVLEITKYEGTKGELEQMKHFLGKFLELVKIRAGARDDEEKLRFTMDLLMFPRASVNCKIEVS